MGSYFRLHELPEITQVVCKNKSMLRCHSSVSPMCSGSQPREILPPRGRLAMFGDGYDCHCLGGGGRVSLTWVEIRGAAEHPAMHRTASPNISSIVQNTNSAEV